MVNLFSLRNLPYDMGGLSVNTLMDLLTSSEDTVGFNPDLFFETLFSILLNEWHVFIIY